MAPKGVFAPLPSPLGGGPSSENGGGPSATGPLASGASLIASGPTPEAGSEGLGEGHRLIVPVPPDAADPCQTPLGRRASASYRYRDTSGALLAYVIRIEEQGGGKRFVPLAYAYGADGIPGWIARALPVPRPLYGLDRLAQRPAGPVLIVEGEKAADAATRLFPAYVAVTSPGGAKAASKAGWKPLAGRDLTLWPDNDAPGKTYAREAAKLALAAGARSARIVQVPDGLPEGWDLADERPANLPLERLPELLASAVPFRISIEDADPHAAMPTGFRLREDAVEFREESENGEARWHFVCTRLEILAATRNADGKDWGRLLRVIDPEGRAHLWPMPMELLGGEGAPVREQLLRLGLRFEPRGRGRLLEYIARAKPSLRVLCAARLGWHGSAFVLPDGAIGPAAEPIFLQTAAPLDHAFAVAGTLAEWQESIGRYCAGNSRLVLTVCAALAAPLLQIVGMDGGGFHLRGASSSGKTTALRIAASVCGDPQRYVRTWRSTANGLEGAALAHNDALLALDELGQIDGREAGQAIYMLANGEGKSRARKDASARPVARWRILFLSSGEQSLADKAAEAGQRVHAGQETRLIDVPADAERGMGLFEALHGYPTADAFARALTEAVAAQHGTPLRAFLERIAPDRDGARKRLSECMTVWLGQHCPPKANGQVKRVARRFALLAAAGEEAARLGILPWPDGEAARGAAECFGAWLGARGGAAAGEEMQALRNVADFLTRYGESRFAPWQDAWRVIPNRAGFRRSVNGETIFLIFKDVFRTEICRGIDPRYVADVLKAHGLLLTDSSGYPTRPERLPDSGGKQVRVYCIKGQAIAGFETESDAQPAG